MQVEQLAGGIAVRSRIGDAGRALLIVDHHLGAVELVQHEARESARLELADAAPELALEIVGILQAAQEHEGRIGVRR